MSGSHTSREKAENTKSGRCEQNLHLHFSRDPRIVNDNILFSAIAEDIAPQRWCASRVLAGFAFYSNILRAFAFKFISINV